MEGGGAARGLESRGQEDKRRGVYCSCNEALFVLFLFHNGSPFFLLPPLHQAGAEPKSKQEEQQETPTASYQGCHSTQRCSPPAGTTAKARSRRQQGVARMRGPASHARTHTRTQGTNTLQWSNGLSSYNVTHTTANTTPPTARTVPAWNLDNYMEKAK